MPLRDLFPGGNEQQDVLSRIKERQLQVESGGRHRDAFGKLIESPAGALGIAQIMPGTGVDPGFGVAPLKDDSEAEALRFRDDYMRAMSDRYGGNVEQALAAYNWGPGNVDKVRNDPNWKDRLPGETRSYLEKILGAGVPAAAAGVGQPRSSFGRLMASMPQVEPEPEGYLGTLGGLLGVSAGSLGRAGLGLGEYAAGQAGLTGVEGWLGDQSDSIKDWQDQFYREMDPVFLKQIQSDMDVGGDFWDQSKLDQVKSLGLKGANSLATTVGPIVGAVVLSRITGAAVASSILGLSEGMISAGLTAEQIRDDIAATKTDDLLKIDRFAQLYDQLGEDDARRQYTNEVQGLVPVTSGILVGAIAKAAGLPLDWLIAKGAGTGGRLLLGGTSEGMQEGPQSAIEQIMSNYARMGYESDVDIFEGVRGAAIEGTILGALMGSGATGILGPRRRALEIDPVPGDVQQALNPDDAFLESLNPQQRGMVDDALASGDRLRMRELEGVGTGTESDPNMQSPASEAADPTGTITLFPDSKGKQKAETFKDEFRLDDDFDSLFRGTPAQPWDPSQDPFSATSVKGDYALPEFPPDDPRSIQGAMGVDNLQPLATAPSRKIGRGLGNWLDETPPEFQTPAAPPPAGLMLAEDVGPQPMPVQAAPPAPPDTGLELAPAQAYDANQRREPRFASTDRTYTEQQGYRVRVTNPQGQITFSKLYGNRLNAEQAYKKANEQTPEDWRVEMLPARRTFKADRTPTPEAASDVMGQLDDMRTDTGRQGVYLTRETMENLDEQGLLDQVLKSGVPINNVDTYGGVAVMRDEATAQEAMQYLEDESMDIDQILGMITGAGSGKPAGAGTVVQKLDDQGRIVRERLVRPEEAKRVQMEWGEDSRVLPLDKALAMRQARYEQERQAAAQAREEAKVKETAPEEAADIVRERKQTQRYEEDVKELAGQGGTRVDVGKRLLQYAADVGAEARNKRKVDRDVPLPEEVKFRAQKGEQTRGAVAQVNKVAKAYEEGYSKLTDLAIRLEMAKQGTQAEALAAQNDYDEQKTQLLNFLREEGAITKAEALAKAATKFEPKSRKQVLQDLAKERDAAAEAKRRAKKTEADRRVAQFRKEREESGTASEVIPPDVGMQDIKGLRKRGEHRRAGLAVAGRRLARTKTKLTPNERELASKLWSWMSPTAAKRAQSPEISKALVEINQGLRNWLSDYQMALMGKLAEQRDETVYNQYAAYHGLAGQLSEMLGLLRGTTTPSKGADIAAQYVGLRFATMVRMGKRVGVDTMTDIDGFWTAVGKGPVEFARFLSQTVQPRTDVQRVAMSQLDGLDLDSLSDVEINQIWLDLKPPGERAQEYLPRSKKIRDIRRAQKRGEDKDTGGRSKSMRMTRKSQKPEFVSDDYYRAENDSVYNTSVLTYDPAPRDETPAAREAREQKVAEASRGLKSELLQADNFVATMPEFLKEQDKDKARFAGAYFRWLHGYAGALLRAGIKSEYGAAELTKVATDLQQMMGWKADEFVENLFSRSIAEFREQTIRFVNLSKQKRTKYRLPAAQRRSVAQQQVKLLKDLRSMARLHDMWMNSYPYHSDILPVVRSISQSIQLDGWPSYNTTPQEREAFQNALEELRTAKFMELDEMQRIERKWGYDADTLYKEFYKPLYQMAKNNGLLDEQKDQSTRLLRRYTKRRFGTEESSQYVWGRGGKAGEAATRRAVEKAGEYSGLAGVVAQQIARVGTINKAIADFYKVVSSPHSRIDDIAVAEEDFIEKLAAMDAWVDDTINIDRSGELNKALQQEMKRLRKLKAKTREEQSAIADKDIKRAEKLLDRIKAIQEDLKVVSMARRARISLEPRKWTPVGPRLRNGEITKAQAARSADVRLKGYSIGFQPAITEGYLREALTEGTAAYVLTHEVVPGETAGSKATRLEQLKREQSPEQRRLSRAIEERGLDMLPTGLGTPQKASEDEIKAAVKVRGLVEDIRRQSKRVSATDAISQLLGDLPADHPYSRILRVMLTLPGMSDVVIVPDRSGMTAAGRLVPAKNGLPARILINEGLMTNLSHADVLHTVVHEMVHAATVTALVNSPELRQAWNELRRLTISQLKSSHQFTKGVEYSNTNLYEFVAEVFSNRELQEAMRMMKVRNTPQTLWDKVLAAVKKVFKALGFEPDNTLLDVALSLSPFTFRQGGFTEAQQRFIGAPLDNRVAQLRDSIVEMAGPKAATAKEKGAGFMLSALSQRQIDDFYSKWFGGEEGPLSKYMRAFKSRDSFVSELLGEADKLSREWTRLEEIYPGWGQVLSQIMTQATVHGIHPDAAFTPGEEGTPNGHLRPDQREAWEVLRNDYNQLADAKWESPSGKWNGQRLYKEVRDFYKKTTEREVKYMLANALRASKLWDKSKPIEAENIDLSAMSSGEWIESQLGTKLKDEKTKLEKAEAGLNKAIAEGKYSKEEARERRKNMKERRKDFENTLEEVKLIARMARIPTMNSGPYFPLMRFGDYAVQATRTVEDKVFDTAAERSAYMKSLHDKDPTLQFSFPETEGYGLTVKEVEFRLAETQTHAAEARKELVERYGEEAVSPVQLKNSLFGRESTIQSNQALQSLLGKLEGNAGAQAAIREFYLKSLADTSFRKREVKRKNLRGVDSVLQHRTFGAYAKSAAFYTAQLKYGHVMATAKAEMKDWVNNHRDESGISAIRMGQVLREIEKRDENTSTMKDVSTWTRKAVETGQLWLLLSPSYWMVNASQPYMVTIPWLSGHGSLGSAIKHLKNAQKMVAKPLVNQAITSWAGIKALKSRIASEEAFSVLDEVERTIANTQGDKAPQLLNMLDELKKENLIDLSFIAELRDVALGETKGLWDKIMDASRIMAHLTEVNNRIITSVAAYNMGSENGMTHEQAIKFAKDAVAQTQFDYSSSNKARLFSQNDAAWKPIVFQFMQYTQHMYVLFVKNFVQALKGATPAQKRQGRRIVLGMLATHFAAGGLLGVTMPPVKWALGLALMGLADDEDKTFKNWLSGDLYDRMMSDAVSALLPGKASEVVRGGVPRAFGVDLSNRMSFLSAYMMDLNPKTAETLFGSLLLTFGGPTFGIAGNVFEAGKQIGEGDVMKGMEKLVPKMFRDFIRTARFGMDGMTDYSGKEMLGADEMSPWELFMTSLGFQPSQMSEVYARNARAKDRQRGMAEEKQAVMREYRKQGNLGGAITKMMEFNKGKPPNEWITVSDILRSRKDFLKAEQNIRRFGVDAGKYSWQYADDTYNVE